ncbi:hypothetical protein B0H14DRAFT_3434872 [Mycena olivaceomarginata]|nr:hypothetical protein B0H14DRAFT_3434872 [Mycena olivaceomarginata]
MEDNKDESQKKVVTYFATRPDAKGGKLFFTQSALSKKLQKKAEMHSLIEQGDFDSEFLHFADGEEGTPEIPEYLKLRDEDEQDEEDLEEPEFQFSKHEALNAVAFLQNIAHHRPDLDVSLPVRTTITSFFK